MTQTSFSTNWGWVWVTHSRAGSGYYTWDSFGSFVAERVARLESDPVVEWVTMLEIDDSHYRVEWLRKSTEYCDGRRSRRYITQGPYYGGQWASVTVGLCEWRYEAPFVERILNSFTF